MKVDCRWYGQTVVVAGSGPGLTEDVAARCQHHSTIAVNDAYLLMQHAQVLYAADSDWWDHHAGVRAFKGERWSVLETYDPMLYRRKLFISNKYHVKLVGGSGGTAFSPDPQYVTYGSNSGFQAINLAMHFGAVRIVLVGFNMNGDHFFGKHPPPLRNSDPGAFIKYFAEAAALGGHTEIINATPNTELKCFPMMSLDEALA